LVFVSIWVSIAENPGIPGTSRIPGFSAIDTQMETKTKQWRPKWRQWSSNNDQNGSNNHPNQVITTKMEAIT
jgi:hypothetical protein